MALGCRRMETGSRTRFAVLVVTLTLLLGACAGLPEGYPRTESRALWPDPNGRIARIINDEIRKHPGKSGIYPLEDGQDSLAARLALTDAAERSLDIQYYIWHQDATGQLMLERILRAADRGVRIRLLLDDIGSIPRDESLLALDAHPHIDVRIFNPTSQRTLAILSYFFEFRRINGRMHNKSMTADSQVTIIGGRNIGDEYFENHEQLDFGDLDVLALGPVVQQVVTSFDVYWNSKYSVPVTIAAKRTATPGSLQTLRLQLANARREAGRAYVRGLNRSPLNNIFKTDRLLPLSWGLAYALYDEPGKVDGDHHPVRELMPLLEPAMNGARRELLVVSSYFIPGKEGLKFLTGLRRRGVNVRVVTNSVSATDIVAVHGNYARYRMPLLKAGVELYEIKSDAPIWSNRGKARKRRKQSGVRNRSRSSLHTKAFFIDREQIFVGSLNLDPRSIHINTEIGLLVHNQTLARDLVRRIDARLPANAYRLELVKIDPANPEAGERIEWVAREGGYETRYRSEPHTNALHRIIMWFASLPPFEGQF